MAAFAAHVAMHSLQRKRSPLVVVEQRRLPLGAVMALCAGGHSGLGKLFAMNVFVAILALGRSRFEVDTAQPGLEVGRLMAIHAGGTPIPKGAGR